MFYVKIWWSALLGIHTSNWLMVQCWQPYVFICADLMFPCWQFLRDQLYHLAAHPLLFQSCHHCLSYLLVQSCPDCQVPALCPSNVSVLPTNSSDSELDSEELWSSFNSLSLAAAHLIIFIWCPFSFLAFAKDISNFSYFSLFNKL